MVALLEALPPLQALAVAAIAPGVAALALAFFAYDAGRLVRTVITGRL